MFTFEFYAGDIETKKEKKSGLVSYTGRLGEKSLVVFITAEHRMISNSIEEPLQQLHPAFNKLPVVSINLLKQGVLLWQGLEKVNRSRNVVSERISKVSPLNQSKYRNDVSGVGVS